MPINKMQYNASDILNYPANHHDPTTQTNYANNVKNWVETEKNLVDTVLWQPTTAYAIGNMVKTPSLPSQYCLVCTTAGKSGASEPSYSGKTVGSSVSDGSVTWRVDPATLAANNVIDLSSAVTNLRSAFKDLSGTLTIVGGHFCVLNMQVKFNEDYDGSGDYYLLVCDLVQNAQYVPKFEPVDLSARLKRSVVDYYSDIGCVTARLGKGFPNSSSPRFQILIHEISFAVNDILQISGMWYV